MSFWVCVCLCICVCVCVCIYLHQCLNWKCILDMWKKGCPILPNYRKDINDVAYQTHTVTLIHTHTHTHTKSQTHRHTHTHLNTHTHTKDRQKFFVSENLGHQRQWNGTTLSFSIVTPSSSSDPKYLKLYSYILYLQLIFICKSYPGYLDNISQVIQVICIIFHIFHILFYIKNDQATL